MSNVVVFPKGKLGSPPQSMEELLSNIEDTKREHIEYILDEIMTRIFGALYDEGFDLGQDDCVKTTSFFVETFKAAILKSVGLDHPLHKMAEELCHVEDEPETPVEE